ncbi:triosephosphate isomerase [Sinomonas cellulolyticus]|uniref:triose-phosphate isomerase family protein n=1 Tax=Sinomonas cellulolyticus TaxID=2801916 RepID=UPI0019C2FB22|nr:MULTISPECIES: triose-phosphate isomerase family protein [Sinomonas]GHG51417.1 triosephosphate isomerase [Sinomonas sp. KCTC 49339]
MSGFPPFLLGTSTKMYFTHERTLAWCRSVAEIARRHPAVRSGTAGLFVVPGYLSVPAAVETLDGAAMVGAQDLATEDFGPFTGEVSGAQLAEIGCTLVEVGHAERRRLFGEDDAVVRAKAAAALRNGLIPLVCIGEPERLEPRDAAAECIRQVDDALAAGASGPSGPVVVAYEPQWAIGAPEPADPDYIRAVCRPLREHVRALAGRESAAVIYGGSAGPGLLTRIADSVDGLFLGRFAHDPAAVEAVLDEVWAVAGVGVGGGVAGGVGAGGADV